MVSERATGYFRSMPLGLEARLTRGARSGSARADGRGMASVEGLVSAAVFRTFLEQLMLGATQPIFLVVDGHSIHKAKLVSEYVASTNGMLELHFLPPYSPQLNPDEQVWKSVKERVAKQKPLDKISLRRLIQGALERLQTLPEIVRGFFRHPDCARTI